MIIRTQDGVVEFGRGSIGPRVTQQQFLASSLGAGARVLTDNPPHVSYGFDAEPGISMSAWFSDGRLNRIFACMHLPGERVGDWSDWSEARELQRDAMHAAWLRAELGPPPYEYAWGAIAHEYTSQDGESDIVITYVK